MLKVLPNILIFALTALLGSVCQADDVYNFYFEKDKGVKESEIQTDDELNQEDIEDVEELRREARRARAKWKAARRKQKSKKRKSEGFESKTDANVGRDKDKVKKFSVALGVGSIESKLTDSFGATTERNQRTFEINGSYFFSKDFDLNLGVILPNGEGEFSDPSRGYSTELTPMSPIVSLGVGTTPIKLLFFKVGGHIGLLNELQQISFGDSGDSNTAFFIGPKVSMKFSESVKAFFAARYLIADSDRFQSYSFNLAYLW